ncbi:MAG: hypothetical protein J0H83_00725 [Candidatus Melainabacteria bacterium]|jgi:hypothetical protein|nr:hypothetical protein [Candidatus Melainabacteria bacterium]MBX9672276.1 hypothetical protein [Candidatus Obscuribacterales bacterium]
MARLQSEDEEYKSHIEISAGNKLSIKAKTQIADKGLMPDEQTWQYFTINLTNGGRSLDFCTPADSFDHMLFENEIQNAVQDIQAVAHAYLLCRTPQDEVALLAQKIETFVAGDKSQLLFEPSEPSLELMVKRVGGGFRVYCHVDAGNVETGIYRYDALGIRFFTTQEHLMAFASQLRAEFAC